MAGIGDMSAKGGEEIEGGTGGRRRRIRADAATMVFGLIGDLVVLWVVAQSIQSHRRVNTISGQAFSRLMVLGRDAVPLKYGEARMTP